MKIHTDIIKSAFKNPVVTLGIYDGVHLGHCKILKYLVEKSKNYNGESVVLTFWPHPRLVLSKHKQDIKFLNTLEEKQILLKKIGIDHLIIFPFTKKFSKLSAKKFVKKYLIKKIQTKHLIIGYNHRFGKKGKGNFELLKKFAGKNHLFVEMLDAKMVEEEKISSSLIRNALEDGKLQLANKYLGYNYFIRGIIVKGKKLGRTIGFPTANIDIEHQAKLIPKDGVYAAFVAYNGDVYQGMVNIGLRPTIDENTKKKIIEVHIINFGKSIYNQKITLIFVERIRNEIKFESINALKTQLESDKTKITNILNNANSEIIKQNNLYHE